jgi:hypothetical protein
VTFTSILHLHKNGKEQRFGGFFIFQLYLFICLFVCLFGEFFEELGTLGFQGKRISSPDKMRSLV